MLSGTLVGSLAWAQTALDTDLLELPLRPGRGLRAEVAHLILNGTPGGPLSLAAVALPELAAAQTTTGPYQVPVVVEVVGSRLLEGLGSSDEETTEPQGERSLELDLFLYAVDAQSAVVGHTIKRLSVPVDRFGEALYELGLKIITTVELPATTVDLRCLIYDGERQRYGLAATPLTVRPVTRLPAAAATSPLTPPRFFDDLPWILAHGARSPNLAIFGDSRLPTAQPVITAGGSHTVAVTLPRDSALSPSLRLSAVDDASSRRRRQDKDRVSLQPAGAIEVTGTPWSIHAFTFEAPALASGRYRFELEPAASTGAQSEGFLVSNAEALAFARLRRGQPKWTEVVDGVLVAEDRPEQAVSDAASGSRSRWQRTVTQEYLELLLSATQSADVDATGRELARREKTWMEAHERAVEMLLPAQLVVARDIAVRHEDALVPILLIETAAYRVHGQNRQFQLASHSRQLAAAMTGLADGQHPHRSLVAIAVVALAGQVDAAGLQRQSLSLLHRALELDPEQVPALLALAAGYEKRGWYQESLPLLERALALDKNRTIATLQLAIQHERLGEPAEAERLLRPIVRTGEPWVASLASQQLARMLIRQDRLDDAHQVIAQGRRQAPNDSSLLLLESYLLERQRQPKAAGELLKRLAATGRRQNASPRHRYTVRSQEVFQRQDEQLKGLYLAHLPSLAAALEAEGIR